MTQGEMNVRRFEVAVAGSPYKVEAVCVEVGADLIVVVGGGEGYHIGALGLSIVIPSLKDADKLTHSTYQVPVPGHKEEALAREGSRELARRLNKNVVMSVGIHEDDLSKEGIQRYTEAFNALVDMIGQAYQV
jgi:hypothetical protein